MALLELNKRFLRQQVKFLEHHKPPMLLLKSPLKLFAFILILSALFLSGCKNPFNPKSKQQSATLLKTDDASQEQLYEQINYMAKVDSMSADMNLKFEDNSYASQGIAEKYKTADGKVIVQRPSSIFLKVEVPLIGTDVAQMASNGERFCVAILQDGGSGKYKKFVCGTNDVDYSALQKRVVEQESGNESKDVKQSVNAFANLRPQHFTDAVLVRPIDKEKYTYLKSTIVQEEIDFSLYKKKSPLGWVLRGYYLLDEFGKADDGSMQILRRFWFDRVGGIRLARQQIFDKQSEIESDIVYGTVGGLTETEDYKLPLRIEVTRPKEKYKMSLVYKVPKAVNIGKEYPVTGFTLKNTWELEELDLDKKLLEAQSQQTQQPSGTNSVKAAGN